MRGTEEQFNELLNRLAKTHKSYEERSIKHYQWADSIDKLFESYGWSKAEFYKELRARTGQETNESREEKKKAQVSQKSKQKPRPKF